MVKKMQSDDWQGWAKKAQEGDKIAYEKLLRSISPYIRNVLKGSLSDGDSIEDITQEILISVHKALGTYSPNKTFKPWLYSIIQFRRIDYLRKYYSKRDNMTTDLDNVDFIKNYVTDIDHLSEYKEVEKAIEDLPHKQRHVFTMMKIEGYTAKEVAQKMDMSPSAVKVSVHRTLKKLKKDLA